MYCFGVCCGNAVIIVKTRNVVRLHGNELDGWMIS